MVNLHATGLQAMRLEKVLELSRGRLAELAGGQQDHLRQGQCDPDAPARPVDRIGRVPRVLRQDLHGPEDHRACRSPNAAAPSRSGLVSMTFCQQWGALGILRAGLVVARRCVAGCTFVGAFAAKGRPGTSAR